MQRYTAASCTSAVNNTALGGPSVRDTARADTSSLPGFALNSRRSSQLSPYKLKCEKEPLNSRLGPPDFHPQSPHCPEETLTREYVQTGYRETVEGIEEAREISLTQVEAFSNPVVVLKCKEAIRKRLRAINESRAQKRKAGQVYGVPLSGSQLTKPGIFPEQRPCGEDFRKKWIEGLSQPHKRLRTLADHVPHGYRRKSLFEVLIKNNVPLLRATWFIKVTYLNQVRPGSCLTSTNIASGASEKTQLSRTEQWTRDAIDYLQCLLDEYFSRTNSSTAQGKDRSLQVLYSGSAQKSEQSSAGFDGEEPSIHFKWWYMVRLLEWHYAEGLLLPAYIIEWVLNQLKDKEVLEILQLLLPIIFGFIESLVLSQTYVRILVGVAVGLIRDTPPGGLDLVDSSRRAYTVSALVELLRYLVVAVPDTFVGLDCFPLPPCVIINTLSYGNYLSQVPEDVTKIRHGPKEVASVLREKWPSAQYQSSSINSVVSSIQRRADDLAKAASPGYLGLNVAKSVEALDKALVSGDVSGAYKFLFENSFDGSLDESWMTDVSPWLRASLKWIGNANSSSLCSVFFLCEWATSDFRDFRSAPPHDLKFSGRRDYSQIYIAMRLLKLKMIDMKSSRQGRHDSVFRVAEGSAQFSNACTWNFSRTAHAINNSKTGRGRRKNFSDLFESPGPLHDVIVCWIDQHEMHGGDGSKRLQLIIMELIRTGVFYPQSYVRQLIVSGIMDQGGTPIEKDKRRKHYRVLKQMPVSFVHNALKEAEIAELPLLLEVMHVYKNERRLLLRGLFREPYNCPNSGSNSIHKEKHHLTDEKNGGSSTSVDQRKGIQSPSNVSSPKCSKSGAVIEELKSAISSFLQLPSSFAPTNTVPDEFQGSVKRCTPSSNKVDIMEGTPGCDECRKAKRQKVSEEKNPCLKGSLNFSDDEDSWWAKKGPKSFEPVKVDPPLKPTKQASRGRQKVVRKTQSLAQLAAARIESSQGASTSHVCDNKITCPHHKTSIEGDASKAKDGIRGPCADIFSIGKGLKQLRFIEKRTISGWLISVVKQLVEDAEKNFTKGGQFNRSFTASEEKNPSRWKLGEEEMATILYLMDICNDLISSVRFLLWLLPKILGSPNSTIHGGRNMMMLQRAAENNACEVGELFLLSSIRRYENVLLAADLIPEVLSAMMHRTAALMASSGRVASSSALTYVKHILKKYGCVPSVIDWEKSFKATCDKRFLAELESGRSLDAEMGFPLGVPSGVEDLDDYLLQKISCNRLSRVGLSMRDIVQRHVEDAFHYFFGKEKKHLVSGAQKVATVEKWDDGHQIAKQIIMGLIDCIRQTGGAAQEGDPSLVSSAVSAIVSNVGPALAKLPDFTTGSNYANSPPGGSLSMARRILRIHVTCLCLLKEALGERHSRVFEIALATEASSALAGAFSPVKPSRTQFQVSPEGHDSNSSMSSDILNSTTKVGVARPTKIAAAVSSLVIGAVVNGVTSLERMVTVFRLKEGLDVIKLMRSLRCTSNGNARQVGTSRAADTPIEVYVHWFRLLIGNCRNVSDGLIVELLGEPPIIALSRMQRTLPLSLVFPPAYALFAFIIWKPLIVNTMSTAAPEDMQQLYQYLMSATSDMVKHLPFRDVCMRDTYGIYELVASDTAESDFASILENNGLDMNMKSMAFIPLRARVFLNSIIDCKLPNLVFSHDDCSRVSVLTEFKVHYAENETKLLHKLVNVLDTLQPAKFHWQWLELRLLLNEQALIEKLQTPDVSLVDALRSISPSPEKVSASENENNFIEIILTRLLVRPDAAPLFSEVVHRLGRSLEDSMLLQAKWFLRGHDVLLGRKSIRQRLLNIAESKHFSTKPQFGKPWGWCKSNIDASTNKVDIKQFEVASLEEGEVVEEGMDSKRYGKLSNQEFNAEGDNVSRPHLAEKAFIELVLPCIDQSSDDSRHTFANEMIKQMSDIEQQINGFTRGSSKQIGAVTSGIEGPGSKVSNRKAIRGGSPGLARRSTGGVDSMPSPAALRASLTLRMQFLLRLLPNICADGELSVRNMRHKLASVILRLLASRIVQDTDPSFHASHKYFSQQGMDSASGASGAASIGLSCESLFERLLLVLHGLLSSCCPSWMKLKPSHKLANECSKNFSGFDREVADNLQNELDRMQLPDSIRWRIQTAMPVLLPPGRRSFSCQSPSVSTTALTSLQPSISASGFQTGNVTPIHRTTVPSGRAATSVSGKSKTLMVQQQDNDIEIDPWTLLEDGATSGPSSSNAASIGSSDNANLRASSWLKGATRVRRTDLTYVGVVDDDS